MDLNSINDAILLSEYYNGKNMEGKVVSVYDGDTVKIIMKVNDEFIKFNCRLSGIDTPEIRTKNSNEKKYGIFVRDKLREKILNKIVTVHCLKFDKYGRLLVTLFIDNCSICDWLIENKYALSYNGGTKQKWEDYLSSSSIDLINSNISSL